MGHVDPAYDEEAKVSASGVTKDKLSSEMHEHAPVILTEEDVCCP
jgi:hypothetical protein